MKIVNIAICTLAIGFLSACASPRYTGASLSLDQNGNKPEIEIVQDTATKIGFLETMEKWLSDNGYKYTRKPDNSKHDLNKLTLEYVGQWRWDLGLFLSEAKIEAFNEGQRVGEVNYKAPNNLNLNKFSNAVERINYMMDILFGKITAVEATKSINSTSNTSSNASSN
ncbi:MAG: Sbal_3080 family lipoprotein [Betaproteobacteria bacterium]